MLYVKKLVEMSPRLNILEPIFEQYENYPVLEEDLRQETTYD